MEQAILFVMGLYKVSREVAVEYFTDEIEAYIRLMERNKN